MKAEMDRKWKRKRAGHESGNGKGVKRVKCREGPSR